MRRMFLRLSLALAFLGATAAYAVADVQVNVKISPDQIAQCSTGQLFTALGNTGTKPIGVHLCFVLKRDATTLFGPVCGRLALAAGETRMHEFTFLVPPMLPPGNYSIGLRADASDGTNAESVATFAVVAGTCPGAPPSSAGAVLLNNALQSVGAQPDSPTPTTQSSWGQLKVVYR